MGGLKGGRLDEVPSFVRNSGESGGKALREWERVRHGLINHRRHRETQRLSLFQRFLPLPFFLPGLRSVC